MSEISKSLDKLFSFITSANMGFVLIFFLAIYPVYMFSVLRDLESIPRSFSYNAELISISVGAIDVNKLFVGASHCAGAECSQYLNQAIESQISSKAFASIPKHIVFSLLGTAFVVFSACMWFAVIIGVKNNGKIILLLGTLISIPAAIAIAGPDKHSNDVIFCSDPAVNITVYSPFGIYSSNHKVPVCYRL